MEKLKEKVSEWEAPWVSDIKMVWIVVKVPRTRVGFFFFYPTLLEFRVQQMRERERAGYGWFFFNQKNMSNWKLSSKNEWIESREMREKESEEERFGEKKSFFFFCVVLTVSSILFFTEMRKERWKLFSLQQSDEMHRKLLLVLLKKRKP